MSKRAPTAARQYGGDGVVVLRQGFAKLLRRRRGIGEGRGYTLDVVCSPPLAPLFIGRRGKGAGPLYMRSRGGVAKGRGLAPQARGRPL